MSERFDPQGFGSPGRYVPTEPAIPAEASSPPDLWAHSAPRPATPYPWLYPPPPEFYVPRPQPDGALLPPPEHAQATAYPAIAPDGRLDPAQLHGAPAASVDQPRTVTGSARRRGSGRLTGVFLSFGSALLSFALYTLWRDWQFGLGLVLLLLVHEMGHFIVIRAKGLPASLPVFIPFLGAYVTMRRMPQSARDEAEIALAGPLAGALAGAVCFLVYLEIGEPEGHTLLFLAYVSFFINLLNLIPVSPLDGGHIVGAISRWLWPLGLVLLAAALYYTQNLLLLLLGWLWFSQTIARFRVSRNQPYYALRLPARLYISALYFGLAIGLALAFYLTQGLLFSGGGGLLGQ